MLDSPITWVSAVRLGLGLAGEYALLSLIEDAPEALKIGTVICAIGAIAALESRAWLDNLRPKLFVVTMSVLSLFYISFVAYAILNVWHQTTVTEKLDDLYKRGSALIEEPLIHSLSPDQTTEWEANTNQWYNETRNYLDKEVGGIASAKFVNTVGSPVMTYNVSSPALNNDLANLVPVVKNLEVIIGARK